MERITYTRQADGTFVKSGTGLTEVLEKAKVRIFIGPKPGMAQYSLKEATEIIENAIAKQQVRAEEYSIVPVELPEPEAKPHIPNPTPETAAAGTCTAEKKVRSTKYDVDQMLALFDQTKDVKAVVAATGASEAFTRWTLKKNGREIPRAKRA